MKDPEFQEMLLRASDPADNPKDMAVQGLADLVPLALRTLKDALEGADISPSQQTVALNIIDKAKKWEPKALSEEGPSSLWSAIQEIDGTQSA